MAGLPKQIRRSEIYRANFGEPPDVLVVVVSSNEANVLLRDVGVCELLRDAPSEYERVPIATALKAEETTLGEKLIAVGKIANIPKNVLVEREGAVSALAMARLDQAIKVWLSFEPWL